MAKEPVRGRPRLPQPPKPKPMMTLDMGPSARQKIMSGNLSPGQRKLMQNAMKAHMPKPQPPMMPGRMEGYAKGGKITVKKGAGKKR